MYLQLYLAAIFSISSARDPISIFTTEAFHLPVPSSWFPTLNNAREMEYRASLLNLPDLPHKLYLRQPNGSSDALLYGVVSTPGPMSIEIVAMDKYTYNVEQKVVEFDVKPKLNPAQFHVELKLLNVNVEDMVLGSRLAQLVEIFQHHLWPPPPDSSVYITQLTSTIDVGGRLPLNPREKEGVMVRVGASHNFSLDLQGLAREVQPLRSRVPCPRDYRRTSAEHLFRRRGFISDWCHFSLMSDEVQPIEPNQFRPMVIQDTFHSRQPALPRRNLLADFVLSLVLPGLLVAILLAGLSSIVCHRSFLGVL